MIAAFKSTAIDYAIFNGLTERYPEWFEKIVVDHTYVDEFGFSIYGLDSLVEGYDVFVRNSKGEVKKLDYELFDNSYLTINDRIAVPRASTIEYLIYDGVKSNYPGWFVEAVEYGLIERVYDTFYFNEEGGPIPMDHCFVLLRNDYGDLKHIDYTTFRDLFYTRA